MKEIREIREMAAQAQVSPQVRRPVVIDREGDTVYVAMKAADFQAVEEWLARQQPRADEPIADEEARRAEAYEREQRARLAPEIEAYKKMLPELLRTHKGQWVAIHDGQLIDSDESQMALNERVLQVPDPLFIEVVQEEFPRVIEIWSPFEVIRNVSV